MAVDSVRATKQHQRQLDEDEDEDEVIASRAPSGGRLLHYEDVTSSRR